MFNIHYLRFYNLVRLFMVEQKMAISMIPNFFSKFTGRRPDSVCNVFVLQESEIYR